MLHYMIAVSLCWAIFYLPYYFWLRRETFFAVNRWYLLGSLVLGLLIPLVELPAFIGGAAEPLSVVYQAPILFGEEWLELTITPKEKAASQISIWLLLQWVYYLGLILTTGRLLYGLGQIATLCKRAEIIIRPGYKLVITNQSHLPFSFFNLLFQSRAVTFLEEEEQQIHRHELTHISGWHSVDVLLIELLSIVLWCSPMVYIYRESLRDVHEYLADAAVLKTTRKKQYSQLLFRQFQSGLQIALANHFIRSQFKKRITMMTRSKSRNGALLKYLLIFPVLAMAVFLFAKRTTLAEGINWAKPEPASITIPDPLALSDSTRQFAEQMPRFPGCENLESLKAMEACSQKLFLTYVYKGIQYPKAARAAGLEGTVIVSFTIDEKGGLKNSTIKKEVGGGLGEEVIRLLNEMPQWIPGKDKGKAVAVEMTLPVKFALESSTPNSKPQEKYDVMPIFAGCGDLTDPAEIKLCTAKKMTQFISENIKYPTAAKELGIEGKVLIEMVIDEQGKISQAEVVKSVGGGLDEEALRAVKSMPDWKPAQKDGKVVKSTITLPITFDLPIEHKVVVIGYPVEALSGPQLPRFPGCESETDPERRNNCAQKSLLAYVFKNISYPKAAKEAEIEGTVVASFVVMADGSIGEVEILRSPDKELSAEVERLVLTMNDLDQKWIPGEKEGKKVAMKYTLPIKFALTSAGDKKVVPPALELNDFSLSPNPNSGRFELRFGAQALPTQIRITDAAGKVIFQELLQQFDGRYQQSLELEKQVKGSYFLYITQRGKGQFTHTFVVQ